MPLDQIFKFVNTATPTMILSVITMALILIIYELVKTKFFGKQNQGAASSEKIDTETITSKIKCTEMALDRVANAIEHQTKISSDFSAVISKQGDTIERQNEMLKEFRDINKTQSENLAELRKAQEQHNYRADMNFTFMVEASRMRDKIREEGDAKISGYIAEVAKVQQQLFNLYERLLGNPAWRNMVTNYFKNPTDFPKINSVGKEEKGEGT